MKKIVFAAMAALVTLGFFAACGKDDDNKGNNNGNDNGNNSQFDMTLAYGAWECDTIISDGQTVTTEAHLTMVMNPDGTGELENNGNALGNFHGSPFTYTVNGDKITIFSDGTSHVFTINSLTANTLSFTGRLDNDMPSATLYFHKSNGNNGGNTYDEALFYGAWESTSILIDGQPVEGMTLGLYFYTDHTGVMVHNGESENNDFTWSLNGETVNVTTTHNGNQMTFHIVELTATILRFTGEAEFDGQYVNMDATLIKTTSPDY